MSIQESLSLVLSNPIPDALWQLREELVANDVSVKAPSMVILDDFYHFLNKLVASSTAREYSHFASILDMGAIAGVSLQNLLQEDKDEEWGRRFLIGAVSESLMVLAARQYVKAWEEEMKATYYSAAYTLWKEYWQLSILRQPDLSAADRRLLVERLIDPIGDENIDGVVKAGLIVTLFQLLLLFHLHPLTM